MKLITKTNRVLKYILFILLLILVLNMIASFFTMNFSNSYPVGIYFIKKVANIERDKYYIFCPKYDEKMEYAEVNGFWRGINKSCGKTPKYLKKALGMPQDKVIVTDAGVTINGKKIPNTHKVLKDKIFVNENKILQENEYYMLSDYNVYSYDSRYFGSINKNQIIGEAIPIITIK